MRSAVVLYRPGVPGPGAHGRGAVRGRRRRDQSLRRPPAPRRAGSRVCRRPAGGWPSAACRSIASTATRSPRAGATGTPSACSSSSAPSPRHPPSIARAIAPAPGRTPVTPAARRQRALPRLHHPRHHARVPLTGVTVAIAQAPDASPRVLNISRGGLLLDGLRLEPGVTVDFTLKSRDLHGAGAGCVVHSRHGLTGIAVRRWDDELERGRRRTSSSGPCSQSPRGASSTTGRPAPTAWSRPARDGVRSRRESEDRSRYLPAACRLRRESVSIVMARSRIAPWTTYLTSATGRSGRGRWRRCR